jgi:hypothetical protein
MLAIASAVEISLGGADPKKLHLVEFDEAKIGAWLVECIDTGNFTACPKHPVLVSTRNPDLHNLKMGYLIEQVEMKFIELQQHPVVPRKRLRKRAKSGLGGQWTAYGNNRHPSDEDSLRMTTAPTQQSQHKLMSGCVIQLSYAFGSANKHTSNPIGFEWTGNWVVTEIQVHKRQVWVRAVLDENRRLKLPLNLIFRVISPPCLVVAAFLTLSDYELIADTTPALTLVYPVSECKLSDFAFSTTAITESVVLEIVKCKNTQDIDSMLRVMSRRKVLMYVLIQDLLPYRYLSEHVDTLKGEIAPEERNMLATYHNQLDFVLRRRHVQLQRPGQEQTWNCYDMHNALSQLGVQVNAVVRIQVPFGEEGGIWLSLVGQCFPRDLLVSTPVSAGEKFFKSGTEIAKVMTWGARKYGRGSVSQEQMLIARAFEPITNVVRTTVMNGIVSRQEVGHKVTSEHKKILVDAAASVIQQVKTIDTPEASHWAAYRFDVKVNDENEWFVVHVSTWESEAMFKDWDDELEVKGLAALGGNKMVLLTHHLPHPTPGRQDPVPVAVYQLRDPISVSNSLLFRNDISIHQYIKNKIGGQPSSLILKMHKAWYAQEQMYMAVEAMQSNLRAGLTQLQSTFGT